MKYMPISKELFEDMLTERQQEEVKKTLKAYKEVNIYWENGAYHFSTASFVSASYASDYEFCGIVYQDDIYTEEERIINYMEAFHDYHPAYKGKLDWQMINEVGKDWTVRFQMVDGNLVRA